MTRSEIREHIFKLVFRVEFNGSDEMPAQLNRYFEDPASDDDRPVDFEEDDENYIKDKFDRIVAKMDELDAMINGHAKGWDTGRIGKVDLAILRLAIFEMVFDDDIPVGVAIDEAVELAKKYGQDESASFVNGILAGIAKACEDSK